MSLYSGDIRVETELVDAMKGFDCVIHLAAISRPMAIPVELYYSTNCEGTLNVHSAAIKNNISRMIYFSSVSALGLSPDGTPLTETDWQPEKHPYGLSKRVSEEKLLQKNKREKVNLTIIRPSLVYGPECDIRKTLFKFVKLGLFPKILGSTAHAEFLYVGNLIEATMKVLHLEKTFGETYNITDGRSYNIDEITGAIADAYSVKKPVLSLPLPIAFALGFLVEKLFDLFKRQAPFSRTAAIWLHKSVNVYSCEKAKNHFGYQPKYSLTDGVAETVEWFEKAGIIKKK